MRYFLFAFALLLASTALGAPAAPASTPARYQHSPAEAQFNQLGNKMMLVVQRALAAPGDAEAIAILQKEGAPLRQQAQQLRPAYAQWLSGLSAREKAGVRTRMQSSSFATYFGTLETDPQLSNRLRSNQQLNQAVKGLLNSLDMRPAG